VGKNRSRVATARLGLIALLAAAACWSPPAQAEPPAPTAAAQQPAQPWRTALAERVAAFPGRVGVAVRPFAGGGFALDGERRFPQHSVFKTWLAIAALDAVDAGAASLSDTIRVTEADLGFPYQPLAERVGPGGYDATLEELLELMVSVSDNPSADLIIRHLGGLEAVRSRLAAKGLAKLAPEKDERMLHADVARLREAIAARPGDRAALIEALVSAPQNSATPLEAVAALQRLAEGALVSPQSTQRLLGWMGRGATGGARLRAGLPEGWDLANKTGSGGRVEGVDLGTNDVGLFTAPDGRRIAVAVFVTQSTAAPKETEALIADVAGIVTAGLAPPS